MVSRLQFLDRVQVHSDKVKNNFILWIPANFLSVTADRGTVSFPREGGGATANHGSTWFFVAKAAFNRTLLYY